MPHVSNTPTTRYIYRSYIYSNHNHMCGGGRGHRIEMSKMRAKKVVVGRVVPEGLSHYYRSSNPQTTDSD